MPLSSGINVHTIIDLAVSTATLDYFVSGLVSMFSIDHNRFALADLTFFFIILICMAAAAM